MKTKRTTQVEGLLSRSELPGTEPLDFVRRQVNRNLPTAELLALMKAQAPEFLARAEVVGRWVWIQFGEKQPPKVTRSLAELGFHWNPRRQTWQHPCGAAMQGSPVDPRTKYGSRPAHAM